jgi:tetratricopeptide (TPR) repeat protein
VIDGLALRAEQAFETDQAASARFSSAACEAMGEAGLLDPQVVIAARALAAMVGSTQWGVRRDCQRELLACYSLATQAGLTRLAVVLATPLAALQRRAGHPRAGVELLTSLLPIARTVGFGEPGAVLICELVSCNLESRAPEIASSYLAELRECAIGSPLTKAYVELAAAKVHLALGNYALALRSAEESTLKPVGNDALVGIAMRLEAEALAGLGQTERALKTIKLAIEMVAGQGYPARLGAAYRVLSRLSDDAKCAAMARRLLVHGKRQTQRTGSAP